MRSGRDPKDPVCYQMSLKSPLIKFARAEKKAMANKRYKRCIPLPSLHLSGGHSTRAAHPPSKSDLSSSLLTVLQFGFPSLLDIKVYSNHPHIVIRTLSEHLVHTLESYSTPCRDLRNLCRRRRLTLVMTILPRTMSVCELTVYHPC